jgi:hypothetical protein
MKITKRQLKRIIKEEVYGDPNADDGFPVELLVHGTIAAGGSTLDVSVSNRGKFMTPTSPYVVDFSLSLDAGPLDFQQMLMDEMAGAGVNVDDHVIHFSLDDMDAGEQLEYGDGGRGMQDFAKDVFTEG